MFPFPSSSRQDGINNLITDCGKVCNRESCCNNEKKKDLCFISNWLNSLFVDKTTHPQTTIKQFMIYDFTSRYRTESNIPIFSKYRQPSTDELPLGKRFLVHYFPISIVLGYFVSEKHFSSQDSREWQKRQNLTSLILILCWWYLVWIHAFKEKYSTSIISLDFIQFFCACMPFLKLQWSRSIQLFNFYLTRIYSVWCLLFACICFISCALISVSCSFFE